LRGDERAAAFVKKHPDLCTTIINVQEVLFGVENEEKIRPFFEALTILSYDYDSVTKVVALKKDLYASGNPIGAFDEMIAGICLTHKLNIVTRNTKHFSRVRGLQVVSW